MAYDPKQYDAAQNFLGSGDDNITNVNDLSRIRAYDLYENIYLNASSTLQLVIKGEKQSPILMPSGKKIIEATNRFLAKNLDYYVEPQGDAGTQEMLNFWFSDFYKREKVVSKFASNKRWGLVRGDAYFMISANPNKRIGSRLTLTEVNPKQVFEIEAVLPSGESGLLGVHIVEKVQDFREPDKLDKKIVRRRTFKKVFDEIEVGVGPTGDAIFAIDVVGISSELSFWEVGKWDDRDIVSAGKMEQVLSSAVGLELEEEPFMLPGPITTLPLYKWSNNEMQNSTWGMSQLAGMETLLYAINQSITDEDATIVFQGLGMYVTTATPPLDDNGDVTDWNVGPAQVIEVGMDQKFDRVSGITDVSPFQNHMTFMEKNGMAEASGTPEVAIGRVDVSVAESGISLKLQLLPLLEQNREKELAIINTMDQLHHDIATQWLPAYESEIFPDPLLMGEMNVSVLFDDPMPKNSDTEVQNLVLLYTSNLILTTMAIQKLRELGWNYPSIDPFTGEPLSDEMIAAMLNAQTTANAAALDPYSQMGLGAEGEGGAGDEETPVDETTVDLGVS